MFTYEFFLLVAFLQYIVFKILSNFVAFISGNIMFISLAKSFMIIEEVNLKV